MKVITRFAPSPTGFLHIGGARTALFNYLFAKHNNGKFLLRIEDTDKERSTKEAIDAILNGLKWFGLNWDDQEIYQSHRQKRHKEIALDLLAKGKAYKCFMTQNELQHFREENKGKPIRSIWRDSNPNDYPIDKDFVIRLKVPDQGETTVDDLVQGRVTTKNENLEDNIILRSDGTPTYMLAVVVDDYDMNITHIIRGDDHLTNTARQILIYNAMNWQLPAFAHIPLIHGPDGKKLSKRHGALGVEAYRDMGYLPETLRNYLLRLGWSHGNDEIINDEQAISWFNLDSIGKSASRMDFKKLENLNSHYIKIADNYKLLDFIKQSYQDISPKSLDNITKGLNSLKERAKTINDIINGSRIYIVDYPIKINDQAKAVLIEEHNLLAKFIEEISTFDLWNKEKLIDFAKDFADRNNKKFSDIAKFIRAAITGDIVSPSILEILEILGKDISLGRLKNALSIV